LKLQYFNIKLWARIKNKFIFIFTLLVIILILKLLFSVYLSEKQGYESIDEEIKFLEEKTLEINSKSEKKEQSSDIFIPTFKNINSIGNLEELQKYVYTIDSTAYVSAADLDIEKLLNVDCSADLNSENPKILIFHTHSQEAFSDSREGYTEDTIIGVGRKLAEILADDYKINVVHDVGEYDIVNGKSARTGSYENMENGGRKILEKYPSVEIAIDLHRDGVEGKKFVTEINGKDTAQIMFFNGITKLNKNGVSEELPELLNPYLTENLGFSLQMFLTANEKYPDFCRKNYIKPYRYSLHLRPKSLLIEVGANTNTVEEAKNAMYPLAEILYDVVK